jgi:hypothetical protein
MCGKENASYKWNVVTHDGSDFMSYEYFQKLCAANNADATEPFSLESLCGVKWRPESFGSGCYAKTKKTAKYSPTLYTCTEITAKDGTKFLFIGTEAHDRSRDRKLTIG